MGSIGHGSFVVLVFQGVEFMREESLAQFLNSERGRKVGEGNGRKHRESLNVKRSDWKERILVPTVIWFLTSRCLV